MKAVELDDELQQRGPQLGEGEGLALASDELHAASAASPVGVPCGRRHQGDRVGGLILGGTCDQPVTAPRLAASLLLHRHGRLVRMLTA